MDTINRKLEVLLEIIFCIEINDEEDDILKNVLPAYLRKLNCFMAGVFRKDEEKNLTEKHLLPMTFRKDKAWPDIKKSVENFAIKNEEDYRELYLNNKFYYFYPLNNYGYLLLGRSQAFSNLLKNELQFVINYLGKVLYQSVVEKQRKISEEKLANERKLLQTIIDNIPVCLYIKDKDLRKTLVNKAEIDFYHKKSESDLLGKTDFDLFDEKDAKTTFAEDKLVLEKGHSFINEEKLVYDNRWAYISKLPLRDATGEIAGILGLMLDVTEKKKQEIELLKLSLAVEQSPVAITITDLKGDIKYVNEAFCNISGYTNDELVDKHIRIIYSNKTPEGKLDKMFENINKGVLWQDELIIKKKNHKYLWTDFFITPIVNENGEIINYLSFVKDISEKKKYESQLKKLNLNLEEKVKERTLELENARLEAEAANKAKSEFLSRMSHELRTPMNSILGFAQLIEMNEENETHKKGIRYILNSGRHLLDLINEILDLSKIESGTLQIVTEEIEIKPLIKELTEIIDPLATKKEINIEYLSTTENLKFKSDKQRLKQILLNLTNNAIKYNVEKGSVTISVHLKESEGNNQMAVYFSVADTGVGISDENLKKLFQPFERIDADKTDIEGTGLGLSVTKKIVEFLGGQIGVESKPGKGSNFWFEIPVTEYIDLNKTTDVDKKKSVASRDKTKGLILYVEDNMSNLALVQTIIEMNRPGVKLINSIYGKNVLNMARIYQPDLILLDLNLPDIDGVDVFNELLADDETKDIPVIVISADAMAYRVEKLMTIGAKSFLTKPIAIDDFLESIAKWV